MFFIYCQLHQVTAARGSYWGNMSYTQFVLVSKVNTKVERKSHLLEVGRIDDQILNLSE